MSGLMGPIPDLVGTGPLPEFGARDGPDGPHNRPGRVYVRPEGPIPKERGLLVTKAGLRPAYGVAGHRDGDGPARLRPWGHAFRMGGGHGLVFPPPLVCASAVLRYISVLIYSTAPITKFKWCFVTLRCTETPLPPVTRVVLDS